MGLMAEKRKRQQEKKSKPSEAEPAKKTVKVDPIPGDFVLFSSVLTVFVYFLNA